MTLPARPEGNMESPSRSLISVERSPGASFGVLYQGDRRQFKLEGQPLQVDANHVRAQVGCNILPFLHCAAEAGAVKAKTDEEGGEWGLDWGGSLKLHLLERTLHTSPAAGRRSTLRVAVKGSYIQSESNFPDRDFRWSELKVTPFVTFSVDSRTAALWEPDYRPTGASIRGGLVFLAADGDYGEQTVEENRNFGIMLGASVRIEDDWVVDLELNAYDAADRTFTLGLGYHF
jgi:hypothetical protein